MRNGENVITKVEKGSIAEELGIEQGDVLVAINGKPVIDVFDYRYLINDEYIELTIKTKQGGQCVAEVEKEYYEDWPYGRGKELPEQVHILLYRPASQRNARNPLL